MSLWEGQNCSPNSANIYINFEDADGTWLSSLLGDDPAEDDDKIVCSVGLCKVINPEWTNNEVKVTAENAKGTIKTIEEGREIAFEVEALIPSAITRTLAHGIIDNYTTMVPVSDSAATITGCYVELFFHKDESDWRAPDCETAGGYIFPSATLIPLGEGTTTIDGGDRKTYRFRIVPNAKKETTSGSPYAGMSILYYTIPFDVEIDGSAEYKRKYEDS